ncbi:MAG: hypothetical protein Q4C53_06975 [Clostridia bacterium]|nr:hypothetical protein [Clostridia bacterium]
MPFCKQCGTFYPDSLGVCPKCNPSNAEAEKQAQNAPVADPKTVKRQWIAILIGIPSLILMYWIIGYVLKFVQSL